MLCAHRIDVKSHDLATIVDSIGLGMCRAREIDLDKGQWVWVASMSVSAVAILGVEVRRCGVRQSESECA
jgi:hypothetical protein